MKLSTSKKESIQQQRATKAVKHKKQQKHTTKQLLKCLMEVQIMNTALHQAVVLVEEVSLD